MCIRFMVFVVLGSLISVSVRVLFSYVGLRGFVSLFLSLCEKYLNSVLMDICVLFVVGSVL